MILIGLAMLTFAKLSSIQNPPNSESGRRLTSRATAALLYATADRKLPPNGKSLNITVDRPAVHLAVHLPGRQRTGRARRALLLRGMVVPTNTTVTLNIVSADVVHSWWVPELGGKFQAVPGYHNYTWFKVSKPGIYTRPVRAALRARPRAHDRDRQGGPAGAVRSLAGLPEAADRPSQRRGEGGARETEHPDRRRTGRKPLTRHPGDQHTQMATVRQPQSPR